MTTYRAPVADMKFLLRHVFRAEEMFATMPDTNEVNDELITAILAEAGKLIEGLVAPINQSGDQQGCKLENGVVTTPAGFKQAFAAWAAGGWSGLIGSVDFGGQGMPKVLSALIEEMNFGKKLVEEIFPKVAEKAFNKFCEKENNENK